MATFKNPQVTRIVNLLSAQLELRGKALTDEKAQAIAREHGRLQADGRYTDNIEFKLSILSDGSIEGDVKDKAVKMPTCPVWLAHLQQWETAVRKFVKSEIGLVADWQKTYNFPIRLQITEWLDEKS